MSTEETGLLLETEGEREFVTFVLGDEEYAIEALKVQEITGLPQITKVPYLPAFIKGVINLRGTVVPVVDLRLKFGFKPIDYTKQTCVIVSKIGDNIMGMIVDAVSEVTMLSNSCIDPTPPFGTKLNTDFMKGVGKLENRLLIILDVDRILTGEEMTSLEAAASAESEGEEAADTLPAHESGGVASGLEADAERQAQVT